MKQHLWIPSMAAACMVVPMMTTMTQAAESGWQQIGNNWYYLGEDGTPQTGWQYIGWSWYYLNPSDGVMATGWQCIEDEWYYLNPSNGSRKTGWLQDGETWYYLDRDGKMVTGWLDPGYGNRYLFDQSGALKKGWAFTSPYQGDQTEKKWHYLGEDGILHKGWLKDNGVWYYLSRDGFMAEGFQDIEGSTYYFDHSGAMKTGWLHKTNDNYRENGWSYFWPDGKMAKNQWIEERDQNETLKLKYYVDAWGILSKTLICSESASGISKPQLSSVQKETITYPLGNTYDYYYVKVTNPNKDYALRNAGLRYTIRDRQGVILHTADYSVSYLYPNEEIIISLYNPVSETGVTREISWKPGSATEFVAMNELDLSRQNAVKISNVVFNNSNNQITFQAVNTSKEELNNGFFRVSLYSKGKLITTEPVYANVLPAGETRKFAEYVDDFNHSIDRVTVTYYSNDTFWSSNVVPTYFQH